MSPTDIAYARLLCAVYCAGIRLWQDRMDGWLAGFEGKGR